MAKFRFELEQQKVQVILNLLGVGYNELLKEISDQLKAGPIPEVQPQPQGNGATQPEAPNG